jgi:NAD(P)-dependent dehydrogenase (short-subunit alcohol dehydrogenase family)
MSIFVDGILRGKVALVTGGGSGIGAVIAKYLARFGAQVSLLGRTQEKLDAVAGEISLAGGQSLTGTADVRQYPAVAAIVSRTVEVFGGLDIVVNSAAGNFLSPAATLSANGFRAVIDIDLCGSFNAARASFEALSARRGCIVNITATQSVVPMPFQVHAGAAKAGIEKLTRDLALEWGAAGIRVNSVSPGPIEDTEGMARLAPGGTREALRQKLPLQRFGSPEEIAEAVLFLCSPAARFITGTSLVVDGGATLLGGGSFIDAFAAG